MMRTSELKKQLAWERKHQEILRNKAERYKAKGLISQWDIVNGIKENYDDCMRNIEYCKETEQALLAELQRRRELPKQLGMQVASVALAVITLGQFNLLQ